MSGGPASKGIGVEGGAALVAPATPTPEPAATRAGTSGPSVVWLLVAVWAVYVVAVWITAAIAEHTLFVARFPPPPPGPASMLSPWDGEHYAAIAEHGYTFRRFAFFPLLPLLARGLGGATHVRLGALLLNDVMLLGILLMLARWADPERRQKLLGQPGLWLLFSPLAFFFVLFYAESLYLFLTLAAVLAFERRRFSLSLVALLLAGLTRPTAICLSFLFVPAVLRARESRDRRAALAAMAAPCVGIAAYLGYVAYQTADWLGYFHIQARLWEHALTVPFWPLLKDTWGAAAILGDGHMPGPVQLLRPASTFAILALLVWGWRRLDRGLLLYALVSLVFIHAQWPYRSAPRYELAIFPAWILLAQTPLTRRPLAAALLLILLAVQAEFFLSILGWGWVA